MIRGASEELFDLTRDPGERKNLLTGASEPERAVWHRRLARALGRDVVEGVSLRLSSADEQVVGDRPSRVRVVAAQGWRDAWVVANPAVMPARVDWSVEGDSLVVEWATATRRGQEVIGLPAAPLPGVLASLRLELAGERGWEAVQGVAAALAADRTSGPIVAALPGGGRLEFGRVVTPLPDRSVLPQDEPLDQERLERLRSLGYVEAAGP